MAERVGPRTSVGSAPTVSVIIPCYRAAHFVADAVSSVVAQGYPDLQIVVVNDGSPDGAELHEVLEPFSEVVEILDRPHQGLAATRNEGIEVARGELLAFLDADDAWKEGFLDRQVSLLVESGADLVYGDAELFGVAQVDGETVMDSYPSDGPATAGAIATGHCVVVMSTVVARADAVRSAGAFDRDVPFCEDLDLWLRMAARGSRFEYHDGVVSRRRIHGANMSDDGVGMTTGWLSVTGRHAPDLELSASDAQRLARRTRALLGNLRLAEAKEYLLQGDAAGAKQALWGSLRLEFTVKRAVAWATLVLLPGIGMKLLRGRLSGPA